MKLQKWIMVLIFVSLVFLSFSVIGAASFDNVQVNCVTGSKDAAVVKDITKIYQQFLKNDGNVFDGILDKNVVWKYEGVEGTVPFAGTFTGKNGVKAFWGAYMKSVFVTKAELRYYLHQGNILDLHWTDEGIVRATGKRYAMETVQRWEFNDKGQVVKLRWYNDTYALYQAFQPNTDPSLSIALHPADYNINGDGPVDALPIVQQYFANFAIGNLQGIIDNVSPDLVFIMAGPQGLTKIAGTWVGPQGLFGFFNAIFTNESYNYFKQVTYTTDGCRVDVQFEEEIVILATGKVVDCPGLHSIVINSNGKVVKFRSYNDTYKVAWGYIAD